MNSQYVARAWKPVLTYLLLGLFPGLLLVELICVCVWFA